MKLIAILLVFSFSMFSINAQTFNTVNNGSWSSPSTWDCNCNPDSHWGSRTFNINHNVTSIDRSLGSTVTMNINSGGSYTGGTLQMNGGAQLNANGPISLSDASLRNSQINSTFTVTGNLTIASGTATIAGVSNVTGNITVSGGSTLNINGDLTGGGNLSLNGSTVNVNSGTFNLNNKIALNSNSTLNNYTTLNANSAEINSDVINNWGTFNLTTDLKLNSSSIFNNYSFLNIGNDLLLNNTSTLNNDDEVIVGDDAILNTSAKINNSGSFYVVNNLTMWNNSSITNDGNLFIDGSTIGGGSITGTGYTCNTNGTTDPTIPQTNIDPNQTICGDPLPVELIYFDLVYENSFLIAKWATASETNNSHFNIYYSTNGKDFLFYDAVEGNGNSNRVIEYSKVLNLNLIGDLYVKIVQYDFDGKNKSLGIKSANLKSENIISIYPNPVDKSDLVVISGAENYQVFVYELSGKLINSFICESSNCMFDTSNLQSGAYLLKLVSSHKTETLKLLVR